MTRRRAFWVLVIVVLLVAGVWFLRRPHLTIKYVAGNATVHVETLGEYPTSIRRIQIEDSDSGNVVLDLKEENGTAQIRNFTIVAGKNPVGFVHPALGSYRVIRPIDSPAFFIQTGRTYRLTIWRDPLLPAHAILTIRQASPISGH